MMTTRALPPIAPAPAFAFHKQASHLMISVCAREGDTLAAVASDNPDVFLRTPVCDERRAPLLRGLAIELTLAGIESRCGVRIETVIEDGDGVRVLPRFEDGLLGWIVDGYEAMSKEQADA